jgi:hypothetical protein
MSSHWQFRHLKPKLWSQEGPWVKLTVWLPTTKSRESTSSWHSIQVCDMVLERSRRGLQLCSDLVAIQLCSRELRRFKVLGVPSGQFRDSISGVLRIFAIWMQPWRRAAENTIRSKVVTYSQVRAMMSLVCLNTCGKSQHQRVSWMLN